jgi:hypothetical protein
MASGDTIPGRVRVILLDNQGNRNRVFGPLPQSKVDYFNQEFSPDEKQYVNTNKSSFVTAPAGSQKRSAPNAVFMSGERLIVQHTSSNDSNRDINLDVDAFEIEGVEVDLTRGKAAPTTIGQASQELSGSVAEDDSDWVDIYRYTVPDQTRFNMAGLFEAVGVEN